MQEFHDILLGVHEKSYVSRAVMEAICAGAGLKPAEEVKIPGLFYIEQRPNDLFLCWDHKSWMTSLERHESVRRVSAAERQQWQQQSEVKNKIKQQFAGNLKPSQAERLAAILSRTDIPDELKEILQ